jgi:molybdate transport system substrate-binding protein
MRTADATGQTPKILLRTHALAIVTCLLLTAAAPAAPRLSLYAPGSLRDALSEAVAAFKAETEIEVDIRYAPSGTLREDIEAGAPAHVFAAGVMENLRALERAGKSGPVELLARNRICALAPENLPVGPATLLERMLGDDVKVGTASPEYDPSGEYAFEVFRKTEALKPGARDVLQRKALRLVTPERNCCPPPKGVNVYGKLVADGHADIFLTMCTNVLAAVRQNPGQRLISLPDALAVSADYGVTVLAGAPPSARSFVDYILSPKGQSFFVRYGFSPAGDRP